MKGFWKKEIILFGLCPRRRPKTPWFVLDFKIREIILNCFKPENLGRGGLNSIDFDILYILVNSF